MHARWLAPLALSLLSPALAHADPPAAPAPAAAAPKAPATPPAAPAAKATPAAAAPAAPAAAAKKAAKAAPARKDEPAARAPRPRRAIEQREQAKAASKSDLDTGDLEVSARPQRPIIEFVAEKAPIKFELPELHPGQYSVPTGLTR